MKRWAGRVVWITGAGSGIGRALALEFAAQGARVGVSGRRVDRLHQVVSAIRERGGTALALPCDVTDEGSIASALASLEATFGRLDVVVANAGIGISGPVEVLTMDQWRRQLDVNVAGVAVTSAKAIPYLRKTRGRLALVGSVAAMVHYPGGGPYQASKAAVQALGDTLALELAPQGISCTTLHPGFVASEMHQVGNDGVLDPTRPDRRPSWLVWSAEDAARPMVRAIHRRKRELVFTGHGRLAWFLARHFPGLIHRIQARIENPTVKA
ncbi:MAG: SDR family NAD(P)-dependent oxidoreductase [Alphaproteobacteria bacterium]|nr:SDR family NAD(P)-dependent oxidoreductase [Alphaproteobacteria bacterium]